MSHYLLFTLDGQYIVRRRRPSAGTTDPARIRRVPGRSQVTTLLADRTPSAAAPTTCASDLGSRQAA